jgi:hypothetical protein
MSKKIDERIPNTVGKGVLPDYPAIATPWGRLISYYEAAQHSQRNIAVYSANLMQVYRILIPDYEERSEILCANSYKRMLQAFSSPIGKIVGIDTNNVHPFMRGNFPGCLNGDSGDEALLMCGRVNDFGTYRVEKELDTCPWDIIGTELCRATTTSLQGVCDGEATLKKEGPNVELHMIESRGAGDLHCRIVGENREKFPMPAHKQWESFGPIATADMIKYTPEEEMLKDSQFFREECNYRFNNGTCAEFDAGTWFRPNGSSGGAGYLFPVFEELIQSGRITEEDLDRTIHCVFEGAGKTAFGGFYAVEGVRNWLGVPAEMKDGRVMGGFLEVYLACQGVPVEAEAFNSEEVVLRINRGALEQRMPKQSAAYLSFWYGMTKTLVSALWSLWEEAGPDAADILRVKIAKKIDKFC